MDELVISNLKKSQDGKTLFLLSDGKTYNYIEVIKKAEAGEIKNVEVHQKDDGTRYLYYTNPDTLMANDLYNMIHY